MLIVALEEHCRFDIGVSRGRRCSAATQAKRDANLSDAWAKGRGFGIRNQQKPAIRLSSVMTTKLEVLTTTALQRPGIRVQDARSSIPRARGDTPDFFAPDQSIARIAKRFPFRQVGIT